MGKKEDKLALNAYQAASILGAFGQGFATPDSGYGRTAAALTDSAQGAIAAQANYMAQKKAKKKNNSFLNTATGAVVGGITGGPAGAVAGAGVGALNSSDTGRQILSTGQTAYNTASALKSTPTVTPAAQTPTATEERAPLSPEKAFAAQPQPATQANPAHTAMTTGDWMPVAMGAAAALGGGALLYGAGGKQPSQQKTPNAPVPTLLTAPGQAGGPNMQPDMISTMNPVTQAAWARQNQATLTRPQWNALSREARVVLRKEKFPVPQTRFAAGLDALFGGAATPTYTYNSNGSIQ